MASCKRRWIYPAGLPVARVDRIDRRADSAFARIHCTPLARVNAARYVMVLAPVGTPAAALAPSATPAPSSKKAEAKKSDGKDRKSGPGRPGRQEGAPR